MLTVAIFILAHATCALGPCAVRLQGKPYRELVFNPDLPFQSFGSISLKEREGLVVSDTHLEYWTEKADGWMGHKLETTIGNRSIHFHTTQRSILTVMTRGIDPVVMLDDGYTNFEEFFRVPLPAGDHSLVWITDRRVEPNKGNGFQEPVQTAAWVRFTDLRESLPV